MTPFLPNQQTENAEATLLADCDFAVLDVETTGLSADRGDRVCEIGVVRLRGGAIMDSYGSLIDPTVPVSAGAFAVNGISPAMLAGAPEFPAVAGRIREMIDDAVIVAYNAPFDIAFLRSEFRLAGLAPPGNRVIDALTLARQLFSGLPRHPQAEVARFLSLGGVNHRALDDATVTARIFIFMASILRAYGLTTLGDLSRRDLPPFLRERKAELIRSALAGGDDVWIRYIGQGGGEITQRIVTPRPDGFGGPKTPSPFHLTAWCHAVGAEMRFRIDNILDLRPVDKTNT